MSAARHTSNVFGRWPSVESLVTRLLKEGSPGTEVLVDWLRSRGDSLWKLDGEHGSVRRLADGTCEYWTRNGRDAPSFREPELEAILEEMTSMFGGDGPNVLYYEKYGLAERGGTTPCVVVGVGVTTDDVHTVEPLRAERYRFLLKRFFPDAEETTQRLSEFHAHVSRNDDRNVFLVPAVALDLPVTELLAANVRVAYNELWGQHAYLNGGVTKAVDLKKCTGFEGMVVVAGDGVCVTQTFGLHHQTTLPRNRAETLRGLLADDDLADALDEVANLSRHVCHRMASVETRHHGVSSPPAQTARHHDVSSPAQTTLLDYINIVAEHARKEDDIWMGHIDDVFEHDDSLDDDTIIETVRGMDIWSVSESKLRELLLRKRIAIGNE